jgi:GTPase SAR1 family protein
VHLSDIHIKSKKDHVFDKLDSLIKVLECNIHLDEHTIVIVSGDITYSGSTEEYEVADIFFLEIKNRLVNKCKTVKLLFVPGNHDCDFKLQNQSVRKALLQSVASDSHNRTADGVVDELASVQQPFRGFANQYMSELDLVYGDALLNVYSYEEDGAKLLFKCFNTAWASQMHEQPGLLTFPLEKYESMSFSEHEVFTISMFHHSLGWLNPDNAREFKGYLQKTSSIVITGHDHVGSAGIKYDFSGDTTEMLEGAVLQDSDDKKNSAFSLVKFNFAEKIHCVMQARWSSEDFYKTEVAKDWFSYEGYKGIDRVSVSIHESFKIFLKSLEISILNRNKVNIFIDDIFIFPDLSEIQKPGKKATNSRNYSSKLLFSTDDKENKFLIIGEEKCGKTTLAKKLFLHYFDLGYMPVYIEGSLIRSTSHNEIDNLINRNAKKQYKCISYNQLVKNDKKKKLVIIDDFHVSKLNSQGKSIFIDYINKCIPNVIVTGNSIVLVEEISSNKKLYEMFSDYDHYGVKDFGKLLRYRLVDKWNKIGRENIIGEKDLISENDRMVRIIDSIVGNNLVPSYPLYLLTIIQSIEAGTSFSPKNSTFGYYYEFLITRAFGLSGKKPDELDLYYNYATELAWQFFKAKTRELSSVEVESFHHGFCDEFQQVEKFEMISTLLLSGILCAIDGCYRFSQKYAYYFFVAKYIAGKLSDEVSQAETKMLVEKIAERVHIEEFYNILMFLSHFSKDPFILKTILTKSKIIFHDIDPIKFQDDISGVNKMLTDIPKVVMLDTDYKSHRERALEIDDSLVKAEIDNFYSQDYDLDADIENLNYITKLNLSFKMVEILGQIVRSHFGSLRKPIKYDLVEEAYKIGLRSLNVFFIQLQEDCDRSVNTIMRHIKEKKVVNDEDVEDFSRRVLFNLCELISYGFLKKISTSLGSERLFETFLQVLGNNQYPSVKLIDLCIKLEFENNLPYALISKLIKEFENNFLSQSILKKMVMNYVYMFPTTAQERQRICSILGISGSEQKQLELGFVQGTA